MVGARGGGWLARARRGAATTLVVAFTAAGLWYAATWAAFLPGRSRGVGNLLGMGAAVVLGLVTCLLLRRHAGRFASPAALRLVLCVVILAVGVGGLNGTSLALREAAWIDMGPHWEP